MYPVSVPAHAASGAYGPAVTGHAPGTRQAPSSSSGPTVARSTFRRSPVRLPHVQLDHDATDTGTRREETVHKCACRSCKLGADDADQVTRLPSVDCHLLH